MTGASQRRERGAELVAAGVHMLGQCVFLHVVVDTVFDRTSSDYAEVKAMCSNEMLVEYYKYTNALS